MSNPVTALKWPFFHPERIAVSAMIADIAEIPPQQTKRLPGTR